MQLKTDTALAPEPRYGFSAGYESKQASWVLSNQPASTSHLASPSRNMEAGPSQKPASEAHTILQTGSPRAPALTTQPLPGNNISLSLLPTLDVPRLWEQALVLRKYVSPSPASLCPPKPLLFSLWRGHKLSRKENVDSS